MAPDDTIASTDLTDFIAGIPKCELHVHLEGTLGPELARNAFEVAWISAAAREAFIAELDAYAAAHGV